MNGAPVGIVGAIASVGIGFLVWLITNSITLGIIIGSLGGLWAGRWCYLQLK